MFPADLLAKYLPWLNLDIGEDWAPDPPEGPEECELAARDRDDAEIIEGDDFPEFEVIDLEAECAQLRYRKGNGKRGKVKRTKHRPVNLSKRRVVAVIHQMGVERRASSKRWRYTTAHRVIRPDAVRLRLHPLPTRLVCSNGFDRKPWHGIGIEVAGNFEGLDGSGNWWAPDVMGSGRASDAQLAAVVQEIASIDAELAEFGAKLWGVVPHRISGVGRNKRTGKLRANRPICPGSRVWSAGERAAVMLGLRIPGPDDRLSVAKTIPEEWRSEWYELARDAGLVGIRG